MKKDSKERLFEVMGRLDKTFKPKETLNEEVEESKPQLNEEIEAIEAGAEEVSGDEEGIEVKSTEDKLTEVIEKIDELHAMVHGEDSEEEPAEPEGEESEIEVEVKPEEDEVEVEIEETLNEDHLKDRESQVKFICKHDKECTEEDLKDLSDEEVKKKYLATEKKMGIEEGKEEVPVAAVAKVGEAQ